MKHETTEIKWEELSLGQKMMFTPIVLLTILISIAIIVPILIVVATIAIVSILAGILGIIITIPFAILAAIVEKICGK